MHRIAVTGGELVLETTGGSTEPILVAHGISSSRRLWLWLQDAAPELDLVMPDLRGRGDSVDVQGPSSIAQHADDLVAVLDALQLDAVHVCGMSMGGFIGVDLATRFPDRVRSLTLVDGGFPMTPPAGLTPEMLPTVFADRLARLDQRWSSVEAYAAFFTGQTAPMLDPDDPLMRRYLEHDLSDGRVRLSGPALLEDAAAVFFAENRWQDLVVPVRFLHAQWSSGKDTPPAYDEELVARYAPATVTTRYLPGLDHAGSIMTPTGAAATAELLREALA